VLGAGSLVAGLAGSVAAELAGRAVQGAGSALIAPAALALLFMMFGADPKELTRATNLTPSGPARVRYNATTLDGVLGLLTLAVLLLGARGVRRARGRARRRRHRSWILAGARTAPYRAVLIAVAAYPQLAERLMGGREVTWEAAAYGWPTLTVLVRAVLLATFATLVSRASQVARRSRDSAYPSM
jgi:MFS family permease